MAKKHANTLVQNPNTILFILVPVIFIIACIKPGKLSLSKTKDWGTNLLTDNYYPVEEKTREKCNDEMANVWKQGLSLGYIPQFLYCQNLLTIGEKSEDAKECINDRVGEGLHILWSRGTSSQERSQLYSNGYFFTDLFYAKENLARLNPSKALPPFLDIEATDKKTNADARRLLRNLFDPAQTDAAYAEILALVEENNRQPGKEKLRIAKYRTVRTIGDVPIKNGNAQERFISVRTDDSCTYLASLIPALQNSPADVHLSNIGVITICDGASLNRIDGKNRNGVWLFNWKPSPRVDLGYEISSTRDGRCWRCHFGKSKFIPPDFLQGSLDKQSLATLEFLSANSSIFRQPADFLVDVKVDGVVKQLSQVSVGDVQIRVGFPLEGQNPAALHDARAQSKLFEACGVSDPAKQAAVGSQMNQCSACHTPSGTAASYLTAINPNEVSSAAVYPLILRPEYSLFFLHRNFDKETIDCIQAEAGFKYNMDRWNSYIKKKCESSRTNTQLSWLMKNE